MLTDNKGRLKLAAREPITDMLDVEVEAVQKATDYSNFEYRADADADAVVVTAAFSCGAIISRESILCVVPLHK